jgi:CRISPR/Cas system-associated protein endoribonuclease Cas2
MTMAMLNVMQQILADHLPQDWCVRILQITEQAILAF